MKKQKNLKKLLDLEKIDLSILSNSEKQVIHGGYNSQGCTGYTNPAPCPSPCPTYNYTSCCAQNSNDTYCPTNPYSSACSVYGTGC